MKKFRCHIAILLARNISSIFLGAMILLSGCSDDGSSNSTVTLTSPPVLSLESSYDTFGQARDVIIDGNFIYVADGSLGLTVLKKTFYDALVRVGQLSLSTAGKAYAIEKKDTYLFMAAREGGVYVIDVSVPELPVLTTIISLPSVLARASYLNLSGNTLYVSSDDYFTVVDVTDPANPVRKGHLVTSSLNQHISISGNYAYVAGYNKGLRIIDISNPNSPVLVLDHDLNHTVISVEKKDNIVFLGGVDGKVFVLDISRILSPKLKNIINLPDETNLGMIEYSPHDLVLKDNFLYVADGDSGIQILNISNVTSPIVEKGIDTPGNSIAIAIAGRDMFVADELAGVHLVDIFETTDNDNDGVLAGNDAFPDDSTEWLDFDSDGTGDNTDNDDDNDSIPDNVDAFPLDPTESDDSDGDGVGDNADIFPNNALEWSDMDLDGIGDNSDFSDEILLSSINELDTVDGQARGVIKDGPYIYVADGTAGLRIYKLGIDGSLSQIGAFALAGQLQASARSLLKIGNYLYVTARTEGLYVLDISDPTNPVSVYNYDTPEKATFITQYGAYLYLSDRNSLIIFDITDPSSPVWVGNYIAPNEFEHIVVENGIAYIAAYYTGLMLLDVSDPSKPTKISAVHVGSALWAIEKRGDYVYVGGEGSGLVVFDVSNPVSPSLIFTMTLPSLADPKPADQPPFHMKAFGDYLFVADGYSGVQVVNISNPAVPFISSEYDLPGYTWDFFLDGQTLVVGDYLSGFHVLNLGASIDLDGDGIPNYLDQSPNDATGFVDVDYDGLANDVDTDDDNDGVLDVDDAFPYDRNESVDTDGDGIGNNTDLDDDGDARTDSTDVNPLDTDNDGINNDIDTDDDNDGVLDASDAFPLDEYEWEDLNGDGVGDNHPTNRYAVIDTNMGVMTLELLEDIAPLTTANLIRLAEQGYYDGLIFHRVIDGFMIQGGDPNGNGTGGPGYNIVDEFPVDDQGNLLVTHDTLGVLSMANAGPGTGGSQFFITLNQTGWLDGLHTVFGRIISGTTVLQAIGGVATDAQDRPTSDVVINTITITDVP